MDIQINPAPLNGEVTIPGSKSHTIRLILLAAFATGESLIEAPLFCTDSKAAILAARQLGATVEEAENQLRIIGNGGKIPQNPITIDVGNSGTTLFFLCAFAALASTPITLIGDSQIAHRSAEPLLKTLQDLGATITSCQGKTPITITGPLKGGKSSIECPTSQYLSALLMALPLAKGSFEIKVPLLNEKPYVEMTLFWLKKQKIRILNQDYRKWKLNGNQHFFPFHERVPADFSSASFFICGAALTGATLILKGLDPKDSQGDKAIVHYIKKMGAKAKFLKNCDLLIEGNKDLPLKGIKADLNKTPDALPILAVAAGYGWGYSKLYNVAHARLKETDRITTMAQELLTLGIPCQQHPDGLTIEGMAFGFDEKIEAPIIVNGHGDHRIIMALAIAGRSGNRPLIIKNAEAVEVTFPHFFEKLKSLS